MHHSHMLWLLLESRIFFSYNYTLELGETAFFFFFFVFWAVVVNQRSILQMPRWSLCDCLVYKGTLHHRCEHPHWRRPSPPFP